LRVSIALPPFMRRLVHLLMSPPSRLVRLILAEKRLPIELAAPDDVIAHLPVLTDLDGHLATGLWAIIDHLEGTYPEPSLFPADPRERAETLRIFDWLMSAFLEDVTKRIVFQKAPQSHTGSAVRLPPDMAAVRLGRQAMRNALSSLGPLADMHGF